MRVETSVAASCAIVSTAVALFPVPDGPRLGIEFDEERLDAHIVDDA